MFRSFHLGWFGAPSRVSLGLLAMILAGACAWGAGGDVRWTESLKSDVQAVDFQREHPVEWDWMRQDFGDGEALRMLKGERSACGRELLGRLMAESAAGAGLKSEYGRLLKDAVPDGDPRWLTLYDRVCEERRARRLATVAVKAPRIAFVKRRVIRPSFFAYTEGQSDAQAERHFPAGTSLCMMTLEGSRAKVVALMEDRGGVFRDPAVSWDGRRLAFAWKKSLNEDDYHLYEFDLANQHIRQVTKGRGVADYEPAYLPNGDFVFSSSRCVQTVDCYWTEVSNLYTCDPQGNHIRRLGFDQVHTIFPQVLDDGRVIYTRWDYNDRGQVFPQPLFQMNPDGTNQSEFYGNNSWFPTTITHARGIPGTSKVLAVLCGHHTSQAGKLAVIDPARGRQENAGVRLVSPERETPAERIDAYGQAGELFCYPNPLGETEWLVSYAPDGWGKDGGRFGIYWMDVDGRRELLVADARLPCLQAVPVAARPVPPQRASTVDFRKDDGTYYVQDIYQGPGLEGIERGSVRKMRVVALDFRPAGIRSNGSGGPGGRALISTPVSIGNGSWDVKRVLGETPVHEDGSAFFMVPARTPVYFQALDERGRALQTMRSWSTLQPGENASCVGCHESKNSAPPDQGYHLTLALKEPPRKLEPFYGPARGFSFAAEIQPILDRQCVRCHRERDAVLDLARGAGRPVLELAPDVRSHGEDRAFSLLGDKVTDVKAGREWSDAYLVLTQARRDGAKGGAFRGNPDGKTVRWISSQSVPTPLAPKFAGSTRSKLLEMLDGGHYKVVLSPEEYEKIACWIDLLVPYCGDYEEGNVWNDAEKAKFNRYLEKRQRMDQRDDEVVAELGDGE